MTVAEPEAAARVSRVFLSYTQADQSIAHGIAESLRQAGVTVFDQSNIAFGQDLLSAITQAIEDSDAIVIVVSESSQKSEWMQLERSLALGSALSSSPKIVLPVSIGAQPKIPSELSRIKALSVDPRSSPEQVGAKVLQALRRATPPNPLYLYDSIALQVRSLRTAQLLEEMENLHSAQVTRNILRIVVLVATTVGVLALGAASLIFATHGSDKNSPVSWLFQIGLVAPTAALVSTFFMYKSIRTADFPADGAHDDSFADGDE